MTSFVPDKPGWYWATLGAKKEPSVVCVVTAKDDHRISCGEELGVAFHDSYQLVSIRLFDWIGPVTPHDVVADLVKALEMANRAIRGVLPATDQPLTSYQAQELALADQAVIAALQRYRGG